MPETISNATKEEVTEKASEETVEDRGDVLPDVDPVEEPVQLDANAVLPNIEEEPEPVVEEPEPVVEEPEPVVEEKAADTSPMIPKSRLDHQIAKTRELEENKIRMEEQLKFLQQQQQPPQDAAPQQEAGEPAPEAYDYGTAYKQMQELTLEGESDQAAAMFQEILSKQQEDMTANLKGEMANQYQANRTQEQIQAELAAAATEITGNYPELDIANEATFDSKLTGEINELMGALTTITNDEGSFKYSPAQALKQAVAMKMPQKAAEPQELAKEQKPETGDIAKKVAHANQQPPKLNGDRGVSHGTGKLDLFQMTEDEFDALPASTVARLRGDI